MGRGGGIEGERVGSLSVCVCVSVTEADIKKWIVRAKSISELKKLLFFTNIYRISLKNASKLHIRYFPTELLALHYDKEITILVSTF